MSPSLGRSLLLAGLFAASNWNCTAQLRPNEADSIGCEGEQCAAPCPPSTDTSCAELAYRYELGAGVHQNYATAARLYRAACNEGAGEACTRLAIMYDIGLSVPENSRQAIGFYQKACELGESWSCQRAEQLQ